MLLNPTRNFLYQRGQFLSLTFPRQLQRMTFSSQLRNQCFNYHKIRNVKKTGLLDKKLSTYQQIIHFHGHGALFLKYSNLLDQKVKKDDDKIPKNNEIEKDSKDNQIIDNIDEDGKKLGLIARFKKLTKEYWYVLVPVHVFTSCFWFGGFYYASVCGVDIVGMMEQLNFSDKLINPLRDSHLGHIAVAYILYKVATPARYTVTLGGTTFAIRVLSQRGIIKPMPSKDKLVQMYKDKKEDLQQKVADRKQEFHDKKQELHDKFKEKN